jgi:hypothetical protein
MTSKRRANPKVMKCEQCSFTAEYSKTIISKQRAQKRINNHVNKKREKGEHN